MVKDNVSDFIVKLSNASKAKKPLVQFPYSKLVAAVAEILKHEGYIASIERKGKQMAKIIEVVLTADETGTMRLNGVSRVSKPSRRVYSKSNHLYPVLNGLGRMIISTPKGLMTDRMARRQHLGGEVMFKIW